MVVAQLTGFPSGPGGPRSPKSPGKPCTQMWETEKLSRAKTWRKIYLDLWLVTIALIFCYDKLWNTKEDKDFISIRWKSYRFGMT